ncbi:MAG: ComF family protein [Candidatus Pacebacteria bacterium]|nr:ComF family protein [Candidatus Paceibacterota bacterium]
MIKFLKFLGTIVLDIFFPPFCCNCQKFGTYLCHTCYRQIDFIPMPLEITSTEKYLEKIYVTAHYQGVIKKLIQTYKYKSVKDISKVIAELIWYSTALPDVDLITPIPIKDRKLKKRGFNQTEEICKHLSILMGKPYLNSLIKVGNYKSQASMESKRGRLNNLKDTFRINPQFKKYIESKDDLNKGKEISKNRIDSILIIDDVMTTGTTLNEAAKVLKKLGIKNIYGFAIAHGN